MRPVVKPEIEGIEEEKKGVLQIIKTSEHSSPFSLLLRLRKNSRRYADQGVELYSKYYPSIFKRGKIIEVEEAVSNIDDIIDSF